MPWLQVRSAVLTALVASSTLFALAQPEGAAGPDSAVRLTRGVQRLSYAETWSADHSDPETRVGAPAEIDADSPWLDGDPDAAARPPAVLVPRPAGHTPGASRRRQAAAPVRHPGHDILGRAPPAL